MSKIILFCDELLQFHRWIQAYEPFDWVFNENHTMNVKEIKLSIFTNM